MFKYIPELYWKKVGKKPVNLTEARLDQHNKIVEYLKELNFDSVFEVGAGDGRITELLLKNFHIDRYDCCDISRHRIAMLNRRLFTSYPQMHAYTTSFEKFNNVKKNYDLVIAVEVLQHIPTNRLIHFMKKMFEMSRKHILHIDYYDHSGGKTDEPTFNHPYTNIYQKIQSKYEIKGFNIGYNRSLFHLEKHL